VPDPHQAANPQKEICVHRRSPAVEILPSFSSPTAEAGEPPGVRREEHWRAQT